MKTPGKKFTIEKKLVVQVRYYENMFIIRDGEGERVFTGSNEKEARKIKAILTAYYAKPRKTAKSVPKRRRK